MKKLFIIFFAIIAFTLLWTPNVMALDTFSSTVFSELGAVDISDQAKEFYLNEGKSEADVSRLHVARGEGVTFSYVQRYFKDLDSRFDDVEQTYQWKQYEERISTLFNLYGNKTVVVSWYPFDGYSDAGILQILEVDQE